MLSSTMDRPKMEMGHVSAHPCPLYSNYSLLSGPPLQGFASWRRLLCMETRNLGEFACVPYRISSIF